MLTVGIAGVDGGKMAEIDSLDYLFVAPSASVHRIRRPRPRCTRVWELTGQFQTGMVILCAWVSLVS